MEILSASSEQREVAVVFKRTHCLRTTREKVIAVDRNNTALVCVCVRVVPTDAEWLG